MNKYKRVTDRELDAAIADAANEFFGWLSKRYRINSQPWHKLGCLLLERNARTAAREESV